MRSFISTLIALTLASSVHSQHWREKLSNYFEEIRTSKPQVIPDFEITGENAAEILEYLSRYLTDSSAVVRIRVCDLSVKIARQSGDPEHRKAAVDALTSACEYGNPAVAGVALRYLKTFPRTAFTSSSKQRIAAMVHVNNPHLNELIRLSAFLQLRELAPQIRTFTSSQNHASIRWAAIIGLARMGEADARSEMMVRVKRLKVDDDVVYNIFPDLIFSRTPEAIAYMIEALHSNDTNCFAADAERETRIPCAYRVMEYLAPIIKGFPIELDPSGDLNTSDYPEALSDVRQWLVQNRSYEIIDETY